MSGYKAVVPPALLAACAIAGTAGTIHAATRLDPSTLTKFIDPLPIPGVMPPLSTWGGGAFYVIGMAQVQQQLHGQLPPTTVWGYGPLNNQGGFDATYPARTIETMRNKKVLVQWENDLPSEHLPVEAERCLRVCLQLPALPARVPRVEGEAALVRALQQHEAQRRPAVRCRCRQRDGLGPVDARSDGGVEPQAELAERVGVEITSPQRLGVEGLAHRS